MEYITGFTILVFIMLIFSFAILYKLQNDSQKGGEDIHIND